jgi:hypothetical protein
MKPDTPPNLDEIKSLVNGFRANLRALRGEQTLEAQVRKEYIDPFWTALGWDVANRAHRPASECDVVIEAPVEGLDKDRPSTRRPDYIFKADGVPQFVVEAKKPAVDLKTNKDAIFQAKSYAWSAQIPFAILTDFEEFRLFDTTLKPDYTEPSRGVIAEFDLRFEQYVDQWDVLRRTFGREAVASRSLDALLAKIKHVGSGRRIRGIDRMLLDLRGTEPVDRAFLKHLEDYRLRFAKVLYKENRPEFPEAQTRHGAARLTEATQRLLDRLVFIRVCEDRGITDYGDLRHIVNRACEKRLDVYAELTRQFRRLNDLYNGYLFKPHHSEALKVPGNLLAEFVRSLYPPDGPYRFDAIGDDLLGIIYERFLGSAITVTRGQVEAEQKPEVRHAGGVYYTPRFVVDTIVRRVVGPKIQDKSPAEVLNVRILDPACGSGSFLIAAFQFLIDHCVLYVTAHPETATMAAARKRTVKVAFRDTEGQWHLTPDFRGRLLSWCLYGVDIDQQAVEVTIMSLYLKLLEGHLPPNWQREFLERGLLPPMDNNISCGNSLMSKTDFDRYWDDKYGSLFAGDEEVRFRMNPFDWTSDTRGFGRILAGGGGFDCIIGNPPYIRVQELNKWSPEECEFYKWRYKSAAKGNYDIYVVFVERGLELLAPDGLLGYICPHKFWQAKYGAELRKILARGSNLESILDFTDQQVFKGATTYTAIHVLGARAREPMLDYSRITKLIDGESQCRRLESANPISIPDMARWRAPQPKEGNSTWSFPPANAIHIAPSGQAGIYRLADLVSFSQGFKTGADPVFVVELLHEQSGMARIRSRSTGNEHLIESSILRPLIKSAHMRRFEISPTTLRLVFPYEVTGERWRILDPEELAGKYPRLWYEYLQPNRPALDRREKGKFRGPHFYQYSRQQNFVPLSKSKLVTPDMADRMRFSYDRDGRFYFSGGAAGGVCVIPGERIGPLLLLGILNSRLIETVVRERNGVGFRGGYLNCEIRFLREIPVRLPVTSSEERVASKVQERVTTILDSKRSLRGLLGDGERQRLEREVEAYEQEIDELVLRLYGIDKIPE